MKKESEREADLIEAASLMRIEQKVDKKANELYNLFILAKILFYLLWTILFLYKKKTTLSRGSFKQERIYFFREYLYSNINAINNPSPPKNSTQPQ